MKTNKIFIILFGCIFISGIAKAQFIEDALRLSQPNQFVTARTGGLNISYYGVSDDIGALFYNPAGLSLIAKSELSIGFGFNRASTETDFLNNSTPFSSNNAYISHLGVVVPFKMSEGNAAIGISYFLENNFTNNYKYSGYNTQSSMINELTQSGARDINSNVGTYLWLADSTFKTAFVNNLQQSGFVQEDGGIHNITGGAAFDLNKYVGVGFTISGKWGTYSYKRDYTETDINNLYVQQPNDLYQFAASDNLEQDIGGITGSIGIQGRIEDFLRLGVGVKFPTFYTIQERFWSEYSATFRTSEFYTGDTNSPTSHSPNPYNTGDLKNSYNIKTPFVYSAGVSVHAANITFAAGVEYSDATQLKFSDPSQDLGNSSNSDDFAKHLNQLNTDILVQLVGQTTWGFGLEYEFPILPLVARASYSSTTSPYQADVPGASTNIFSVGGGIYLAPNIRLDGLFQFVNVSELRTNYPAVAGAVQGSSYVYKYKPLNLGLQLTYRY